MAPKPLEKRTRASECSWLCEDAHREFVGHVSISFDIEDLDIRLGACAHRVGSAQQDVFRAGGSTENPPRKLMN